MNRRDFCVTTPLLLMGCGGSEDMAQEFTLQPSPSRNTGAINTVVPFYEDSTWTPSLTSDTPGDLSVAYSYRLGRYVVIGNTVFIEGVILTSTFTHTTASGEVRITGLPDKLMTNQNAAMYPVGSLIFEGITKANYTQFSPAISSQETFFTILCSGSGQASNTLQITEMPSGGTVWLLFSIRYKAFEVF